MAEIFEEDVKRLQKLDTHVIAWVRVKQVDEELEHVLLQEKLEYRRIILIAPDQNFGDRSKRLCNILF